MKIPTLAIAWPVIVLSYFGYMTANIEGLIKYPDDILDIEYYENYGLKKFQSEFVCLYFGAILFFSSIFSVFIKLLLNFNDEDLKATIFKSKIQKDKVADTNTSIKKEELTLTNNDEKSEVLVNLLY